MYMLTAQCKTNQ